MPLNKDKYPYRSLEPEIPSELEDLGFRIGYSFILEIIHIMHGTDTIHYHLPFPPLV